MLVGQQGKGRDEGRSVCICVKEEKCQVGGIRESKTWFKGLSWFNDVVLDMISISNNNIVNIIT